jgi:hypothetical protein
LAALVAAIPSGALLLFLQYAFGSGENWTWYVADFVFYTVFVILNAYSKNALEIQG